jgi:hypothetical protein
MIARTRHSKTPEISLQNKVRELAPELPPMFPEMSPVIAIDCQGVVSHAVFKEPGDAEKEAFSGRPLITEQLKFGALGQQQERNLVKLVTKSDREALEKRLIHSVRDRSSIELISLPLHPDLGSCLDQTIDRPITQLPQWTATLSRMGDWGNGIEQINFALQMDLDNFPVLGCTRKMVGDAFVEEYM